jgi:hypothetical protein
MRRNDAMARRVLIVGATLAAACVVGAVRAADLTYKGAPTRQWLSVKLTETGCDRATAYTMSNKVVQVGDNLLATWIDVDYLNHWALVSSSTGQILNQGTIGFNLEDNHCGAGMWKDSNDNIYVVTGSHWWGRYFDAFKVNVDGTDVTVNHQGMLGRGTYPAVMVDSNDTLHLAYRYGPYDSVRYMRRPDGGSWTAPTELVTRDPRSGSAYQYWTQAFGLGADGRLHQVFLNYNLNTGSVVYGASHAYSDDGGVTWNQYGTGSFAMGTQVQDLATFSTPEHETHDGPYSAPHPHINLSNPVIDDGGLPWVVFDNGSDRAAYLYHYDGTEWISYPLNDLIEEVFPGFGANAQSALSRHADGTLEILLNTGPLSRSSGDTTDDWGNPETEIVRILMDPDTLEAWAEGVAPADPDEARWLPAIQQWTPLDPFDSPAMLYTYGSNYDVSRQTTVATVYLQIPVPVPGPGDFDANGVVGLGDFSLFGDMYGLALGDADYDALFDLDGNACIALGDFSLFAGLYGTTYSHSAAVPEPATCALVAAGALTLLGRRRRQSRLRTNEEE